MTTKPPDQIEAQRLARAVARWMEARSYPAVLVAEGKDEPTYYSATDRAALFESFLRLLEDRRCEGYFSVEEEYQAEQVAKSRNATEAMNMLWKRRDYEYEGFSLERLR